jgi:L-threonylcarbamoyladenylate synthase
MLVQVDEPRLADLLLRTLACRGVVIMPCDTIYGLVGVAPDTEARIRALKGRQEKSFLQLIPSAQWLPRFTAASLPEPLRSYWPGPLTIIFPSQSTTVALRVPDDERLQTLMRALDRPLYSTSVNRSGSPALWRIEEIVRDFEAEVDLVIDAGDLPSRQPSTILDTTSRPFRILREGAVRIPGAALDSAPQDCP